jgi:ABC-type multidrug transport system fused ATPase/permease subunit
VNLDLPVGSTLGLVGSSGAGKTTLVDLLLGLLVPSEGTIELDGVGLESILADWRSRVGYVPQEVAIFDGTIAQNVALAWNNDFDPSRVENALKRAQLWDFVAARDGGINSSVGDHGMALSGGQRQRLGIARALYGDPLILVMDEATSALDTKTESDVVNAIRNLRGEVTVVSVAHRLATIRDNDQLCFMRDGEIVAQGTFDHLVSTVPDFAVQAGLAGLAGDEKRQSR